MMINMYDADELLDLVNENDEIISVVARGEYYKNRSKNPGYLRAVELLIRNDKGQLWIPRRRLDKKIAPGGLDYSAGGHVGAGEDYMTGLVREVEEELNLQLDPKDLELLKMFIPSQDLPYFRGLYLYESNVAPNYSRDDFTEYYWMTPQKLLQKLEASEPAKSSMLSTLKAVMDKL